MIITFKLINRTLKSIFIFKKEKSVFIMPVYVQLRDSVTKNGSQSGAVLVSESRYGLSDVTLNKLKLNINS